MVKIIFLVEEESMAAYLNVLVPRITPNAAFQVVTHSGKSDLKKSIGRKVEGWKEASYQSLHFIILLDQDKENCTVLKRELNTLIGQDPRCSVRIVVKELESWHLGDKSAAQAVYPDYRNKIQKSNLFKSPDRIENPAKRLKALVPSYQKISGSRTFAEHVNIDTNSSRSFQVFVRKVRDILE